MKDTIVDLQHIPEKFLMKRFINEYDPSKAIVIALSPQEHRNIKINRNIKFKSVRDLMAYSIRLLRKNTNVPNEVLVKIIYYNIKCYPIHFNKR